MSGPRIHVYMGKDHRRVRLAAQKRGVSISHLTAIALSAFLDADKKHEAQMQRRFDHLSKQIRKLDRDLSVLSEALALFIQLQLAIAPPVPISDQTAARAQTREHFSRFIEHVALRMASGHSLVDEITSEITPVTEDVSQMDQVGGASEH